MPRPPTPPRPSSHVTTYGRVGSGMPPSTFRTADGAQIGYAVVGTRTAHLPLVLINGMSAIMDDWAALAHALGETRQGT